MVKKKIDKLKFEDEIPEQFRNCDTPLVIRSVGELIEQLMKLPRDLPLEGHFCRGAYSIEVVKILQHEPKFACRIEAYDDELDDELLDSDENFDIEE